MNELPFNVFSILYFCIHGSLVPRAPPPPSFFPSLAIWKSSFSFVHGESLGTRLYRHMHSNLNKKKKKNYMKKKVAF